MQMPVSQGFGKAFVALIMAAGFSTAGAAATTLYLSNTATSGITPAGLTLSATGSSASGWGPTTALSTTAKYWYSGAQTQSYSAGTWNVVLWTNAPGSSTQKVEILKTASNGGSATVLGSASLDINTTGGGNHSSTFAIALGAQSFSNQRLAIRVTKTAGADAVVAFNGNDFPSRLVTADVSTVTGVTVPAQIEAENYVSMAGVQTEACSDTGAGNNVGWIDAGDSMTYAITVPTTGTYTIQYRVASPNATGELGATWNGASLGTVSIPNTGGWQAWTTVSQTVTLNAGSGYFVINVPTGGWNLNWIKITSATPTISVSVTPSSPSLTTGGTQQFAATVTGSTNTAVTWSADGGSITTSGFYTAPAMAGTYHVKATSQADVNASSTAAVTVTSGGGGGDFNYTIYPGFIGVDLQNKTNGAWSDNQIYVCVIGRNPATGVFSWLKPDGTITACAVADNDAAGHLTKGGQNYSNYFFTLAQSKLLKLPKLDSGRIFVSAGSPMYIKILTDGAGAVGFAGPNVLNAADPNIDVNFEWYEFSYNTIGLWVNTTQVDQFGFPLDLDVYGSNRTFHKQIALTLDRDQIFSQFLTETPAAFHDCVQAPYRIVAPCKASFDTGKANGNYFDSYVNEIWNSFTTNTLTIDMWNGSRRFQGRTVGTQLVFTEVNLNNGAYVGGSYYVNKPTTQDILEGKGTLASGNSTELAIEAQICAAFNRHVMNNGALWATPSAYYSAAPANYYAKFWHDHSVDGLAYGFCYDDVADQSSTVMATAPEHMDFSIRWSGGSTPTGVTVPAQVEAESYASMSGVETEATSDTGSGSNVGWIDTGDSMTYAITVPTTGTYTIQYRVASPNATGVLNAIWNGTTLGSVSIPNTGAWQTWTTVTQTVTLKAGSGNFVISAATGGWNLNWINFTTSNPTTITITSQPASKSVQVGQTASFSVSATTTSGTLAYQWYKNGTAISGATSASCTTPVVAASDSGAVFYCKVSVGSTSVSSSNATLTVNTNGTLVPAQIEAESYASMSGVQTEATSDTGSGSNVGWIDTGDSMTYAITVPTTGTYTIQYRVASPNATGVLSASWNGTSLGSVNIPNTGAWQTWTTVTQTVTLNAGSGNFVISASTGGWNLNWINFTSGANTIAVSISPSSVNLATGGTQQFTATVTGTTNTAVTWSVDGGSVSSNGFYTAPSTAGTYHVKATSQASTSTSATATVIVSSGDVEARITNLINQMSLSEKIAQLHGSDAFNTPDNTRLGIPGFHMADGSYGRIGGTLWPCPIATANTWDPDLMKRYGTAEGKEFRSTGANVALSPMFNLLRDPRWGRSSESYGEDTFLVSQLATAQVQGIQSVKAIAEAKHFACYNSLSGMVTISERALRENYLFQFEKAVKVGNAQVLMAAYNGVNNYSCTANTHLLTDILKGEWGFQGFVNSDWGSIYNCDAAAIAGTDLAMPNFGGFETLEADVNAGKVPISRINDMVRRVLRVKAWAGMLDSGYSATAYAGQINSADSRSVSLEMARKSIVLAKNNNSLLPISKTKATKLCILADPAPSGFGTNTGQAVTWATSYNDGYRGSTYIGCVEIPKTFTQGIQAKLAGTSVTQVTDPASADLILYFTGVPGAGSNGIEGEGFDRTALSIPVTSQMTSTMNAYAAKTVVVISGGSTAVKGPWSAAAGLVIALFPGIDQAQALGEVLFGDVNPSGKLAATWPNAESDVPAFDLSTQQYEEAWEGPGWHYYEYHNIQPCLEFGRGLSYTTFTYSGLSTSVVGTDVVVTLSVKNSGAWAGDEVVQAYVSKPGSSVARRVKDLRGFQRVSLNPGETKQIQIHINSDDLRYWDTNSSKWILEPGAYALSVGSSSKDIRLTGSFNL